MSVLSTVAEFERDLLIERTQACIARPRNQGKTLGRPPALTKMQQIDAMGRLGAGESVAKVARDFGAARQSICDQTYFRRCSRHLTFEQSPFESDNIDPERLLLFRIFSVRAS
jgi:DNA invertase Pin-like site-specific DNA recombinase